jgi:hypothetical protein
MRAFNSTSILIALTTLSVAGITYVVLPRFSTPSSTISGIDIVNGCSLPATPMVGITPLGSGSSLRVTVVDEEWNRCPQFEIRLPAIASEVSYLVDLDAPDPRPGAGRRPVPASSVSVDPLLFETRVRLNGSELERFAGGVEFIWPNALRQTDFGRRRLQLNLGAPNVNEEKGVHARKFSVSGVIMDPYEVVSASPPFSNSKRLANSTVFYITDASPGVLSIDLEDPRLTAGRDLLLVAFSTVLGIALGMLAQRALDGHRLQPQTDAGAGLRVVTDPASRRSKRRRGAGRAR